MTSETFLPEIYHVDLEDPSKRQLGLEVTLHLNREEILVIVEEIFGVGDAAEGEEDGMMTEIEGEIASATIEIDGTIGQRDREIYSMIGAIGMDEGENHFGGGDHHHFEDDRLIRATEDHERTEIGDQI